MKPAAAHGLFVHLFKVGDGAFVYDVNTSALLAVEPPLAAVLPLVGALPASEITRRLAGDFSPKEIARALGAVARGRREGLFQGRRVRLVPRAELPGDTAPRHLVLTLTERCNLRCAYCLHGAGLPGVRPHGHRDMDLATALAAVTSYLDQALPDHRPVISLYGGEPLLALDLIATLITAARRHPRGAEARFALDTNGVLLEDRAVDLIRREKIHLQVSLDGPAAAHDRFRRDTAGRPTHALVMAGLDRLLGRDPAAADRLSFVVTLAPPVDLPAVAEFFREFPPFLAHGIARQPRVRANRADLRGQAWPEADAGWRDFSRQVAEARAAYLAALAAGGRDTLSPVIRALFEPGLIKLHHRSKARLGDVFTPGGNCRPGVRKLHVTVDGRLQPCERTGQSLQIGTLASGIEPAQVEQLGRDFHQAVATSCEQCWALRLCPVCFAVAAAHQDAAGRLPAAVCQRVRQGVEAELRMLVAVQELPRHGRAWLDDTGIG